MADCLEDWVDRWRIVGSTPVVFEGLKGEKTKGLKAALKFAKEHDIYMTEEQIQGIKKM